MAKLFLDVIRKEQQDGTFRHVRLRSGRKWQTDGPPR